MTFCTVCAAPIYSNTETCEACGARIERSIDGAGGATRRRSTTPNTLLMRLLYLAPIALLVVTGVTYLQRETSQQAWLATAYAAAEEVAASGDLVSARQAFLDLTGYRDAESRAQEIETRLAPLQAAYADGLRAIDQGEYATAVALLEPVAQQAPALEDVSLRLGDAKHLLADELHRDVDAAQTVRDWPKAEATLRSLIKLNPADANSRQQLAQLQRERGPLVLGRDRSLWLVAPDGGEERQLTGSLHVIWPTWSPDRSRIAFLAPDSSDPMGNVSLFVVGIDGGAPERLVDGVSAHAAPAWSPDGTRIAYTSFAGYDPVYESGAIGVRVVDVATGIESDVTGTDYALAFNPTWSPDGSTLAFVVKYQGMSERPQHSPGDVLVTKLGSEKFDNLTHGRVEDVWSASWSPQGDSLLLFSLFGQTWYEPPSTAIRVLDKATGDIREIATIEEHPTAPVWSPDGSQFAFTADETGVVISEPDGTRHTSEATQALSGELTWSPDGQALLLAPWNADGPSTLVELTGAAQNVSTVHLEFDANPPFISPPQWSPAVAIPPSENPSIVKSEQGDQSRP
jgi:Tol biopolymer transport system component